MQRRRWIIGLMLSIIALMGGEDVGAAIPSTGGTLTIAVPDEPPGLDPTTSPAAAIARIVYNNLLSGPSSCWRRPATHKVSSLCCGWRNHISPTVAPVRSLPVNSLR
jgi:ABC-type transport system substrate-binding protein